MRVPSERFRGPGKRSCPQISTHLVMREYMHRQSFNFSRISDIYAHARTLARHGLYLFAGVSISRLNNIN